MIYIRLTKRDKEFLNDLYIVRYLNSNRICKLFTCYRSCMNRMKNMVKNKYIRILERNETGEYIFSITKKGCAVIDKEYTSIKKTNTLPHSLACTDFYFSIKNKNPTNVNFEQQYYFSYQGNKYSFRPDILLKLDRWIFVEIDLSGRRFEDKIKTWEYFYKSGAFNKYFDKFPPIIIATKYLDKVSSILEKNKTIDLNYILKDFNEIENWNYKYKLKD